MQSMTPHFMLAFLEGLGVVASPCILPLLPLMLAASYGGKKKKSFGIIFGFIISFTGFALLARQLMGLFDIDPEMIRHGALLLLLLFGVSMLWERSFGFLHKLAELGWKASTKWNDREGFWSGVGIGNMIGLIWTPCAGPLMAAAVVGTIQAKTSFEAVATIALFAAGAGVPMLGIIMAGERLTRGFAFAKKHCLTFRRALGALVIVVTGMIYSGAQIPMLIKPAQAAPVLSAPASPRAENSHYPAPEITGIQDWLNSSPLKLADLRGKVVLVDFWTYSCINCVRTLPGVQKLYEKYRDKGLVVIGVHAPEFAFEKKLANVEKAVAQFGITYPVALDNDFTTWGNFNNQSWPAHYLIDRNGQVVLEHTGEGGEAEMEQAVRHALDLGTQETAEMQPATVNKASLQTPETYTGYRRAENFSSNEEMTRDHAAAYSFPGFIPLNNWALQGRWEVAPENIRLLDKASSLRLNFISQKVYVVLGTTDGKPVRVRVFLNNKPVGAEQGANVKNGEMIVDRETLYEVIDQGRYRNGLLELKADRPGLQVYAFTFGI